MVTGSTTCLTFLFFEHEDGKLETGTVSSFLNFKTLKSFLVTRLTSQICTSGNSRPGLSHTLKNAGLF